MRDNLNNEENQKNEYYKENKKSNLFNIIIGIATLLIAILGATFAYFSATATSDENDVNLKSAYLSIYYDGGTKIEANELIPSSLHVALTEYQYPPSGRRCLDEKGKEVCYVYQFKVISELDDAGTTDIVGSIKVNDNGFENLSYLLYEVTFERDSDGNIVFEQPDENYDPIEKVKSYKLIDTNFTEADTNSDINDSDYIDVRFNKFQAPVFKLDENSNVIDTIYPIDCLFGYTDEYLALTDDDKNSKIADSTKCKTYNITNGDEHIFQLVVWLEETGEVQNEQRKTFAGTISIDVSGSLNSTGYEDGHITGSLNG